MKKGILLLILAMVAGFSHAQQLLNIHNSGTTETYTLYDSDSLYFDDAHTALFFTNDGVVHEYAVSNIDSLSLTVDTTQNVYVEYTGSGVEVTNPLSASGVTVAVEGEDVVIMSQSTKKDINYIISGTSTDGSLLIFSDYRYNLLLDGLTLTNTGGPAINNQSEKKVTVHLMAGTTNTLTDGTTYETIISEIDRKAALFSESKIKFTGSGKLIVNGVGTDKHAIASDDDILMETGTIIVNSASKDGIHASDGFYMQGGNISIVSSGDGIDGDDGVIEILGGTISVTNSVADQEGITCDSTLTISGGTITVNMSGTTSKGLRAKQNIYLNGGTLKGTMYGAATIEAEGSGYDVSYASFIKADSNLVIDGATLNLKTTGKASRGISGDYDVSIYSGDITITSSGSGDTYTNTDGEDDAYHGACIKTDGNLYLMGGNITVSNSGSGGKGLLCEETIEIATDGGAPVISVTTTGSSIETGSSSSTNTGPGGGRPGGGGWSSTVDADESKAIKAQDVVIYGGELTVSSADDGIKGSNSVTFEGGIVKVTKAVEGVEAPFITINDGTISVVATDDGFNATMGTGATNDDGSELVVNGGTVTSTVSGSDVDAMDSNGTIAITAGTVYLNFPTGGPNEGLDANGSITISSNAKVYENGVRVY